MQVRPSWQVALLEGVTGSGKTEVYFEAVAEAIRLGRQSVILMPEIALTAQFIDRFEAELGRVLGRQRLPVEVPGVLDAVRVVFGAQREAKAHHGPHRGHDVARAGLADQLCRRRYR